MTRRNVPLWTLYTVSQYTPLYWPYMFHLVTAVRGLSATEFGVLKGLYYLTVIVGEVPAGIAADRLGRKGAMLLGALTNAAACLLYSEARTFETFVLAELLFGVGTALSNGADSALLYDSLLAEGRSQDYLRVAGRGRMAALAATAGALPLCDAFLIRAGDPTLTYTATACLSATGALSAALLVEPPRFRSASAAAITRAALRELVSNRQLVGLIVYTTACFLLMRASNALFYNPVLAEKGLDVDQYGTLFAAMCIAGAGLAWRVDRVEARFGARTTLVAIPIAMIAMYVALLLSSGPAAAFLFLISGAVSGVLTLVTQHRINELLPSSQSRATLLSVQSVAWRGSYAAASVLLGWVLEVLSLQASITALLAISLALLLPAAAAVLRPGAASGSG